jgi:putative thiamine transport system permease protein
LLPWLIAGVLALPVAVGIAGAALPAFGYLPALGGEALTLEPFRRLLAEPGLGRSVALAFTSGLLTTAVSLAAVLLFVAAFAGTRAFALARHALGPLLAVPHAAAAFGLAFLIAPSGLFFRLGATISGEDLPPDALVVGDPAGLAMMAGLVVKETPFLLLVVYAALPQADALRRLHLARSLGYGRIAGFALTVWPAVYRQIRLPVLAVVAYASSVVDVALILGPSQPAPLAVRVVAWASDPDLSHRFLASAGALLQVGVTLAALAGWIVLEGAGGRLYRWAARGGRRFAADAPLRAAAPMAVWLSAAAVGLGLAALAVWSVAGLWSFPALLPSGLQTGTWARALAGTAGPLATTATVAGVATLLALFLVVALLESVGRAAPGPTDGAAASLPPGVLALLHVPLIVPQVTFVFGLQVLILSAGLRPSVGLLVAAHLVFVAPYVAIALAGSWLALDRRYERIAASLGRGPLRTFLTVRLGLLLGPLLTAAAIGFATSVGLYLPTLLIGAGRLPTITTEAVALASGGNNRTIGAYALLQAALPFLAFALAALVPAVLARRRRGMRT